MALPVVLVRGAGDLASGVALRLFRAGFPIAMAELERPLAVRRTVSFSEAVYDGAAVVEGVRARRVEDLNGAAAAMRLGEIPVLIDPDLACLTERPAPFEMPILVDGRLLKQKVPAVAAGLVIGLGPGFTPGLNCAAVVETRRGHRLGRVYWDRPAEADTGLPEGDPRRLLRIAITGLVRPKVEIGSLVQEGDLVAVVEGGNGREEVRAGLAGVLRGMIRPGLLLPAGTKIGDIDARADPAYCHFVSDKSLAIGGGVLEAVLTWMQQSRS